MGIILDLILIGIVAIAAWRGFRAGLINGIFGILAVVIAIYGANLLANTYSSVVSEMLEPFVSGVVEGVEDNVMDAVQGDGEEDFEPVYDISKLTDSDVGGIAMAVLRQLGITEKSASEMLDGFESKFHEANAQMLDALTETICSRVSYIAIFTIAFLLIFIVFTAIGNVLDLAFGLPGLENLNHILGGVFGAAKGVLVVMVITCICRYLGLLLNSELMESTIIMKRLVEFNFIAAILKI